MTDIHTMTLAQLCDWHAERDGWSKVTRNYDGSFIPNMPLGYRWSKAGCICVSTSPDNHPFPPTRDGAASAMPEGWEWRRRTGYELPIVEWLAFKPGTGIGVSTPDTNDETRDRYLLAALAVMKEAGE